VDQIHRPITELSIDAHLRVEAQEGRYPTVDEQHPEIDGTRKPQNALRFAQRALDRCRGLFDRRKNAGGAFV
jgi:hypothetical protein